MLNLLFPRICNGCKTPLLKAEQLICTKCRHDLPLACYHRTGSEEMKKIFYGRIPLQQATALVQFQKKGITQQILHNLKYRGQHTISNFFGKWLGEELARQPNYASVDMVIPVPLHKQRLRKRGYNQVSGFGKEIAKALHIPFREDILIKISKTNSQVFKKRVSRMVSNAEEDAVFFLKFPEAITNKHILLVDDIITTGATLEKCAVQLIKNNGATLSIATIAIT